VPAGDVEALAAALRRAHGRPRARLNVDLVEFHVDHVMRSLLTAYRSVLGTAAAPPKAQPPHAEPGGPKPAERAKGSIRAA
jgi:hypothetical protein